MSEAGRIIGTIYDADRGTAWLGANDFVYRWQPKKDATSPGDDGCWQGIHKSDVAGAAAGEPVMAYHLFYRLNAPIEFEHQGPYIAIEDMDNLPDRAAVLGEEPPSDFDRRFGLDGMPRP